MRAHYFGIKNIQFNLFRSYLFQIQPHMNNVLHYNVESKNTISDWPELLSFLDPTIWLNKTVQTKRTPIDGVYIDRITNPEFLNWIEEKNILLTVIFLTNVRCNAHNGSKV